MYVYTDDIFMFTETVDESTSSQSRIDQELKHLHTVNERLETELAECRKAISGPNEDRHVERDKSDPPPIQIITQATKTFARKVFSELGGDSSSNSTRDSLDDSMRKVNKYVRIK